MYVNLILSLVILTDLLAGPPFAWVLLNPEKFGLIAHSERRTKEEQVTSARRTGWLLIFAWLVLVAMLVTFKLTAVLRGLVQY